MSAFGLLPSFDVMGFWSLVWKESPLGIRPLSAANGLLLVAWAQLHFIPFKLQATLKCSLHVSPDIPQLSGRRLPSPGLRAASWSFLSLLISIPLLPPRLFLPLG